MAWPTTATEGGGVYSSSASSWPGAQEARIELQLRLGREALPDVGRGARPGLDAQAHLPLDARGEEEERRRGCDRADQVDTR